MRLRLPPRTSLTGEKAVLSTTDAQGGAIAPPVAIQGSNRLGSFCRLSRIASGTVDVEIRDQQLAHLLWSTCRLSGD